MASATDTDEREERQYASIETSDGDVVIYDHDQPTAWIQSDYTVELRQ